MTDTIKTRSTSRNTAIATDILLRDGERVRLLFRPIILNNLDSPHERVKGSFIYQRKSKDGTWMDFKEGSIQQLKPSEGISLELKSSELYKFLEEIRPYYELAEQHGVVYGQHEFAITNSNISSVIKQIIENPGYLTQIIEKNGWEFFHQSLEWLAKNITDEDAREKLLALSPESLGHIDAALTMSKIKSTVAILERELSVDNEEHWQSLFKNNPWILSQIFSYPVTLYQDKAYVGGKAIDNTHGNVIDFLYKNKMTENSVLIEIKRPGASILGPKYRNNCYGMSSELTGGISQLLSYRDSMMKESADLLSKTKDDLRIYYPKCVLIIGNYEKEMTDKIKVSSFENFRAHLVNMEVITFDEVLHRIKSLFDIAESKNDSCIPPAPEDDLPF